MEYNFDSVVQYNRWGLRILGLWPFDGNYFAEFRFYMSIIMELFTIIPIAIYCYKDGDFYFDNLSYMFMLNITFSMILQLYVKMRMSAMKKIVEEIYDDWKMAQVTKESLNLMTSNAKHGKRLILSTAIYMYSVVVSK